MTNIEIKTPFRRPDGLYVCHIYINGKFTGHARGATPTKAKAAARRQLKHIGRRQR